MCLLEECCISLAHACNPNTLLWDFWGSCLCRKIGSVSLGTELMTHICRSYWLAMFLLACMPVVTDEFWCVHFQVWNFIVLRHFYMYQHVFGLCVCTFLSSFFCDLLFSLFNETMSCKIVVWGGAEPTGEFCYLVMEAELQELHACTLACTCISCISHTQRCSPFFPTCSLCTFCTFLTTPPWIPQNAT